MEHISKDITVYGKTTNFGELMPRSPSYERSFANANRNLSPSRKPANLYGVRKERKIKHDE